ncbi:peroxisome assembly protein (Peroxin-2) [Coniosporium apollinis]|uniref:Peroxisome assembly protein (Peroxin-2) n=1 Tax=Coniosporium apollinis TaxID=61459 RepID=A0ABQ9NWI0_9PEZI|nr:peroxisome assembly protein (Peroxin-2) [Coniosporium apollinis]
MSSADFARAQERLAARRQQRESEARARTAAERSSRAASSVSRLPYPFNRAATAGLGLWDTIKGREGTHPAFRVGQVDAELLDEELLELLKGQVGEGLKYFGSHLTDTYAPEILLLLRTALFKLTLWDHNASYGAHLQGLRYTDARASCASRPPPKPWQKAAYGILSIGGRYAWAKWEAWLLAHNDPYDHPSSSPSTSRIEKLSRLTNALSTAHEAAALASFAVFLYNGRYRTLLDRALRLRLTPATTTASREVSFEYLNRQLVWHAFTEFLLFLLPLVGVARWRRLLGRFWRRAKHTALSLFGKKKDAGDDDDTNAAGGGEYAFLPERTCAICYAASNPLPTTTGAAEADALAATASGGVVGSAQTDITNPYAAIPCGHVYCYTCLASAIAGEEGEGWSCLRCGEVVYSCKPWSGDVVEVVGRPASSGKAVGFAEEDSQEEREGEKGGLRDVEPMPEVDEEEAEIEEKVREEVEAAAEVDEGLDEVEGEGWLRASGVVERESETSSDEQSEDYDEGEGELSDVEVGEGVD